VARRRGRAGRGQGAGGRRQCCERPRPKQCLGQPARREACWGGVLRPRAAHLDGAKLLRAADLQRLEQAAQPVVAESVE